MKNAISKTKYVLMALIIAITVSCNGEDGAIGPQGPAGQNGINGIDGVDGNANVIASDWFTVTQSDWSGIGSTKITEAIQASEITQDIVDVGVVLVYHRFNTQTRQLPYSYSPNGLHLVYLFVPSSITIEGFHLNGTAINNISPLEFRYVVIPSTKNASAKVAGVDLNKIKKMSYKEAMDYFGLDY